MNSLELGYLTFAVSSPDDWRGFAKAMLGLEVRDRPDGGLALRADDRVHRLILDQGGEDDLTGIGIGTDDPLVFDRTLARLASFGAEVGIAPEAKVVDRGVRRLAVTTDPSGLNVEIYERLANAERPFQSALFEGGFVMGEQGMGHVLFWVNDLEAASRFWRDGLGYELSDTAEQDTPIGVLEATFLHGNERHHSIAFGYSPVPMPKRCHHFLLEVPSVHDVGVSFERAKRLGIPILNELGQHPNDHMFSFYGATPSGFGFEIGTGGKTIEADWKVVHYRGFSAWGHTPIAGAWADEGADNIPA